ncbi:arginine--tRNA ligase [Methanosphaera sp. WGK6]|uniref:arginine--tRNA ligase n=1 Tax=Methanosphaera sp. WGK6 TaxID=1561964 RepID=UPI00084C4BB2|nr:arginine--tRNA ligase [Methanosphaera sp. WGK6]OED30791.1 arginyl-tRNA synthetase [Methanosphaera sp. WGK6]
MYSKLKKEITDSIEEVLTKLRVTLDEELTLEEPPSPEMGDISSNVAFSLASKLKKSPVEIAEEIKEKIVLPLYFEKVETKGPYLNFFINYTLFTSKVANYIDKQYGELPEKEERILLEHTSANPNGPLHVGHLRNAILGDSLKRVLEHAGYKVESQYYVNDMGRQIAIIVWGMDKFGFKLDDDKKMDHAIGEVYFQCNQKLEENPEYNKDIDDILQRYEEGGDARLADAFETVVEYCIDGIKETLKNLNIKMNLFKWESGFLRKGDVDNVLEKLQPFTIQKDILYLPLERYGVDKELVLRRSNGTSLYATRDLAYHQYKTKNSDISLDILGADHKLAAKQLSIALELSENRAPEVVFYEFIDLPEGSMSTRRGVFVSVDELIEESVKHAKDELINRGLDLTEKQLDEVSKIIGVGSIRFYINQISPEKPITFKWEDALSFERGCASIQYAHARACKLLAKSEYDEYNEVRCDYELEDEEKELVKELSRFTEIIRQSADERRVHHLAEYTLSLSKAFNKFYKSQQVIGSDHEDLRLKLVDASRITLKNSLKLLGIKAPEFM